MRPPSRIICKFFIETVSSAKELSAWQPEIFRGAEEDDGNEAIELDYTHLEEVQEDVITNEELFLLYDES